MIRVRRVHSIVRFCAGPAASDRTPVMTACVSVKRWKYLSLVFLSVRWRVPLWMAYACVSAVRIVGLRGWLHGEGRV